jgi:hypothetical protein
VRAASGGFIGVLSAVDLGYATTLSEPEIEVKARLPSGADHDLRRAPEHGEERDGT